MPCFDELADAEEGEKQEGEGEEDDGGGAVFQFGADEAAARIHVEEGCGEERHEEGADDGVEDDESDGFSEEEEGEGGECHVQEVPAVVARAGAKERFALCGRQVVA